MIKKVYLLLLVACLSFSIIQPVEATEKYTPKRDKQISKKSSKYWRNMADGMVESLIEKFWGASFPGHEKRYYFNYASNLSDMTTEHYWPQAHAMDVIIEPICAQRAKSI